MQKKKKSLPHRIAVTATLFAIASIGGLVVAGILGVVVMVWRAAL